MDEIDFYGDKEVKRNRKYLIIGTFVVAVVIVTIGVSLYVFSSFFVQVNEFSENSSSEKTSWELKFSGVTTDLSNIAIQFNEASTSGQWSLHTQQSDQNCINDVAHLPKRSIICTASISSALDADDELDLKQTIDTYRDIIQESEYFPQIKLVSENKYPILMGKDFQVRETLAYERWGDGISCELTFKPKEEMTVDAKLKCSVTIALGSDGIAENL